MNRRSFIIMVFSIVTVLLWVVKEESKSQLDMDNDKYQRLQQQVHDITVENMLLEEKLLPLESYTAIYRKATEMGMVKRGK